MTTESNSTTESRLVSVELDGTVGRLRLHRPAKRNALTAQMRQDLTIFLGQLASDDRVKVVTLMGRWRLLLLRLRPTRVARRGAR